MTLDEIDQLLAAWEERLRRVDENLLALEGEPTYQMLSGPAGKRAELSGVTAARVSPALDALSELFLHRERLTLVLERARAVRESVSTIAFWDKDEKLAEIDALLRGPSIKMGARPTPLAQRHLLDPAATDVAVVPEKLLEAMVNAYEVARSAVAEVAGAWATLDPLLERAEVELGALRKEAEKLGELLAAGGEIAGVEHDLAAVRARVAKDPLGTQASFAGPISARITAIRQQLCDMAARRERVERAMTRAVEARKELAIAHRKAVEAAARVNEEIDGAAARVGNPLDESLIAGLDEWQAKLESAARARHWQPTAIGLERWLATADEYVAAERGVAERFAKLVEKRTELSGRLGARRAQAQALLVRGASLEADVEERARAAEALLRQRPTVLAEAEAAVDAYERRVVEMAVEMARMQK
jgi:hypothetical protein